MPITVSYQHVPITLTEKPQFNILPFTVLLFTFIQYLRVSPVLGHNVSTKKMHQAPCEFSFLLFLRVEVNIQWSNKTKQAIQLGYYSISLTMSSRTVTRCTDHQQIKQVRVWQKTHQRDRSAKNIRIFESKISELKASFFTFLSQNWSGDQVINSLYWRNI